MKTKYFILTRKEGGTIKTMATTEKTIRCRFLLKEGFKETKLKLNPFNMSNYLEGHRRLYDFTPCTYLQFLTINNTLINEKTI